LSQIYLKDYDNLGLVNMNMKIMQIFPVLILAACTSAPPTVVDVHSTLDSIVRTSVAQTQTAFPSSTMLPSTFTPTATIVYPTPSLIPIQTSMIVITPNAIQVERWREYQAELARVVLAQHAQGTVPFPELVLCEWDILGGSEQEVYVWAACSFVGLGQGPAVIHLDTDGSIQSVEYAFPGYDRDIVIQRLFPEDVQARIAVYFNSERSKQMNAHLEYRLTHREEPPLIALFGTPTP
jgi:hypothetical protein